MVSVLVKSFGGASPALVFPRHRREPGREVAQQGPGTTVQSASLQRAVQVLALIEVGSCLASVGQACCSCGGRRGGGRQSTSGRACHTGPRPSPGDPCEVSGRPLAERAQALCKTPAVGRVIGIPNPP